MILLVNPMSSQDKTPKLSNIYVELLLSDALRTKALAKGYKELADTDKLVLPVTEDALALLDPSKVVVTGNELEILDCVNVENEYDPDKPTIAKLDKNGYVTPIESRFAEYIIENGKRYIDAEALMTLYKIQVEELEKLKQKIEAEKERARKIREARELLKDLIEELENQIKTLEKQIASLKSEIAEKDKEIAELQKVISDYAEFIKTKNFVSDFMAFIVDKQRKEDEDKIMEKYMLKEESEASDP
jgi:vacuolar-type H+-ATPase subunit I/STV1